MRWWWGEGEFDQMLRIKYDMIHIVYKLMLHLSSIFANRTCRLSSAFVIVIGSPQYHNANKKLHRFGIKEYFIYIFCISTINALNIVCIYSFGVVFFSIVGFHFWLIITWAFRMREVYRLIKQIRYSIQSWSIFFRYIRYIAIFIFIQW